LLLNLLLPLFLLSTLGWLLAKSRWLATAWIDGVNELTAKLLIPALLFNGAYQNGLPDAVSWQVLTAYYIPLLSLFVFVAFAFKRGENHAGRALAATFSNTVFVGIPVLSQAFGNASLQFAFPIIAFHGLIAFTSYYLLASSGGSAKLKLLSSLGNTVKNPIVISLLSGLLFNSMGFALPNVVTKIIDMLTAAALPCALLVLGASLANFHLQSKSETALIVFAKLFILPALVLILAVFVLHLPTAASSVLVILAACPVGVNVSAIVQGDGKNPAMVSSSILLSSLACVLTIPLWLWILARLA
jgi:malonate transporter